VGTVNIDDKAITALGTSFHTWATDAGNAAKDVQGVTVKAGTFADATTLATTVANRATALNTNLTNLQKALDAMGTSLTNAGAIYFHTEGENKAKAEFDTLGTTLGTDLPGFDKQK
jgi:hypothetical protein